MPRKTRRMDINNSNNHTTHHTNSVDVKLLNELLQLFRKQALSSSVQLKRQERKRRKREPRVGFNLLISHRLYVQLKNYVELYADRGESMTEIILTGLEKELKERYAREIFPEGK